MLISPMLGAVPQLSSSLSKPSPGAMPKPSLSVPEVSLGDVEARVRLATGEKTLRIVARAPLTFEWGAAKKTLEPGSYCIQAIASRRGRQRFHLFVKTFLPAEARDAEAYRAVWKGRGYHPEIVVFGKRLRAEGGKFIDNRSLWVSLERFDTEKKAEELKKKLEKEGIWGWIRGETIERGTARLQIAVEGKALSFEAGTPLGLGSAAAIEVRNIDTGFWKSARKAATFAGRLEVWAGIDGLLELIENIPTEDYLTGVLPAEMPAEWPAEALKAQAVAARSEVLANLAGKHNLDGFDFCSTEHCRAYGGASGREGPTDAAIRQTKGIALLRDGRFVQTYFCANCGGWSEDNENIWSGPANSALRGKADFAVGKGPGVSRLNPETLPRWLKSKPAAFCGWNSESFRWTRRFTMEALSALVNKRYSVGQVRDIKLEARGVSGRLKSVRVIGTKGSVTISKELNIRLAFGGLPSAMFMIERGTSGKHSVSLAFYGGGRGHGVGLCQDGARGMALAGFGYGDIVRHYFSGVNVTKVD